MDIHSCSYYCLRPACVTAQRDALRELVTQLSMMLGEFGAPALVPPPIEVESEGGEV